MIIITMICVQNDEFKWLFGIIIFFFLVFFFLFIYLFLFFSSFIVFYI